MNLTQNKRINYVVQKHKCTMCKACYNVCPSNAIEFLEDNDGFMYPSKIKEKCTNCGLCEKKCPALNINKTKEIINKLETPECYGGYINDEEIREKSSSGGFFTILSDYILKNSGYICGAAFTEGLKVEHIIIDNKKDLDAIRGSKYVQSNIGSVYKQIKELLDNDKYVLFTGTPCQVAGLYQVLGKDYDKLITVDLLCHGCPSQKHFKQWVSEITNGRENEITNIKFRDKSQGWKTAIFTYNDKHTNKKFELKYYDTPYGKAFAQNLILKKSCNDCKFNRVPRQGDFTIGDFWGIEHHDPSMDDNKGLSAILVNTEKGNTIIKEVKDNFALLKQVPIDSIRNYNMVQWKSYTHPHRADFFRRYINGDYTTLSELITETLNKNDGIALLNYSYSRNNYGSVLAAYALQEKIRKYGYSPVNISYYDTEHLPDISNLEDFRKKYIEETAPCTTQEKLIDLNKYYKTFITGPDVVWFDLGFMRDFHNNFFNFVDFSKNICSYAASFLFRNSMPQDSKLMDERKRLLQRFSKISVRENWAVDICKNTFNVEAKQVLDSVFLLSKEEWKKIIPENLKNATGGGIVSYILNYKRLPQETQEYINGIENRVKLFKYGIDENSPIGVKIEEWLNAIMNCDLLLTDSFHGACFAIIFNKQFIHCQHENDTSDRSYSLMKTLGTGNRIAKSKEDIIRLMETPIDYNKVNENLENRIKDSINFIEEILELHKQPADKTRVYMESLETLIKLNNEDQKQLISNIQPQQTAQNEIIEPYKVKWYFLGIPIFKTKFKNNKKWFYILGIPILKIKKRETKMYYLLFGFIRILKKRIF